MNYEISISDFKAHMLLFSCTPACSDEAPLSDEELIIYNWQMHLARMKSSKGKSFCLYILYSFAVLAYIVSMLCCTFIFI
jgi:hypothetical protein